MTRMLKKYKGTKEMLPLHFVNEYITSNPKFYQTYLHLADYFEKRGENDKAIYYCQQALGYVIPRLDEKLKIEKKIQKLKK